MDREQNGSPSNYDINLNGIRKSLFVLNAGKVMCDVKALKFSKLLFVSIDYRQI